MDTNLLKVKAVVKGCFSRGIVLIYLCVCVFVGSTPTSLNEGRPCWRTSDNATGVCRPIMDCPEARPKPGFQAEKPDTCGINKYITLICCILKDKTSSKQVVALSLNFETNNYISKQVPVSQKKCKEYARLAYERINDYNGSDSGERDRCVRPADPIRPGQALLGEFPFMTLLLQKNPETKENDHICGGTLISERYVMTAAVCVSHVPSFEGLEQVLSVLLGDLILGDDSDGAPTQVIPVIQRIIHPDFELSMAYNDIALLQLKYRANLSHQIRPACLPHGDSLTAESFTVIGWGFRSSGQLELESKLLKVNLVLAPFAICDKYWPAGEGRNTLGIHRPSQLCAGHPYKKNGVCHGDGGGPLVFRTSHEYCSHHVVGIVSFGASPCGSAEPEVFTRIAFFTRWIETIIWS